LSISSFPMPTLHSQKKTKHKNPKVDESYQVLLDGIW